MHDIEILSDKEFLEQLDKHVATVQRAIEAYADGFDVSKSATQKRRKKLLNTPLTAETIEWFGRTYFPHYIRPDANDHEIPLSVFQKQLLQTIADTFNNTESVTSCTVAPRGEAKSTWVGIATLMTVFIECKHYTIYAMDSLDQACFQIAAFKAELESNPRLKNDFPKICGKGDIWKADELVTRNNIKIQGAGTGKKLRGLRHGPYRPDLTICDDIENDENVESPTQRDKIERWLNAAVLGLGEAGAKYDVIYPGTILHPDSVLVRTMKNPTWHSIVCKSIIQYPTTMHLWEKWEEIYRNEDKDSAREFYTQNKTYMDEGAVVSWPQKRPLLYLMELKLKIGNDVFLAEQQGEPQPKDALFTDFTYWAEHQPWTYYGVCDPSLGKGNKSDPSAILVGGVCKQRNGEFKLDVIEAKIKRRTPSTIIADIIALQKKYKCVRWGIETVQYQEFLRQQLIKEANTQGVMLNATPIQSITDKVMRIESLESYIRDGVIRFNSNQSLLLEQLRQFPSHRHDDGPDALEMLLQTALKGASAGSYARLSRHAQKHHKHRLQNSASHIFRKS